MEVLLADKRSNTNYKEEDSQQQVQLLIVVPIYNEEKILRERLSQIEKFLRNMTSTFNLILSVDDSGDDSIKIAKNFATRMPKVKVIEHHMKMGRGYAVREAWTLFDASYYCFIDADLAMGLETIKTALKEIERTDHSILTASRYCPGAKVRRPLLRNAISRVYNCGLRVIFKENIRDHQCGFKMISQDAKNTLLDETKVDSWFWDAELLIKGVKSGFNVREIPVNWVETKYTRTSLVRLFKDIYLHGIGILKLYKEFRLGETRSAHSRNSEVVIGNEDA